MKEDFRIPLLFWIAGLIWIRYSDQWLYSLALNKEQHILISNIKGYAFVTLSSIILYVLIRINNRKLLTEQINLQHQTEQNRLLFDLLNKVENFIIVTDAEGKTTWINQAMEQHSGYTLDELRARYPSEILFGPETSTESTKRIEQAIKNRTHCTVEILNYKKSGEKYWINLHVAPLFNEKQELTGFLSIQSDITKHLTLESQLLSQNNLLRKVTWMTSHDVRRPLSSILSLVDLIKTGTEEEKEECLPLLFQSAEDLDQIIRTVNQKISKLES